MAFCVEFKLIECILWSVPICAYLCNQSILLDRKFDDKLKCRVIVIKIVDPYWQKLETVSVECLYLVNANFVIILEHTSL